MKIAFTEFIDLFRKSGFDDYFSYENLEALYNHLEEAHDDDCMPDVNDLCRDYGQLYITEIANKYGLSDEDAKELDELEETEAILEWLDDCDIDVINVDTWLNVLVVADS